MRASHQSLSDIFTFAPVGIYRSSREGKYITANDTLAKMLGYSTIEELEGIAPPEKRSGLTNRGSLGAKDGFELAAGRWPRLICGVHGADEADRPDSRLQFGKSDG